MRYHLKGGGGGGEAPAKLKGCVGNSISKSAGNQVNFALAEPAEQGDVVLNEVLYDQKIRRS